MIGNSRFDELISKNISEHDEFISVLEGVYGSIKEYKSWLRSQYVDIDDEPLYTKQDYEIQRRNKILGITSKLTTKYERFERYLKRYDFNEMEFKEEDGPWMNPTLKYCLIGAGVAAAAAGVAIVGPAAIASKTALLMKGSAKLAGKALSAVGGGTAAAAGTAAAGAAGTAVASGVTVGHIIAGVKVVGSVAGTAVTLKHLVDTRHKHKKGRLGALSEACNVISGQLEGNNAVAYGTGRGSY